MPRPTYAQLLETNMLIRKGSDISYWLCQTRTVQESKLFPVPAYMMLSYLNCYYRYPELLRRIDAAVPAEELGDRARETVTTASNISVGWCLNNFYLLGRQYLIDLGMLRPTDGVDDVVTVMDFWKRFLLAYHRSDAHLTNGDFGNRSQLLSERQLQVFDADTYPMSPGDRLHTALNQFLATASQYTFLAHCECRLGIHNDEPYRVGGQEMLVRSYLNLAEGDFPWLDGVASAIPYTNLTVPLVLSDTHVELVDDWVSFEAKPKYDSNLISRVGLYTADLVSDGFQPVSMGSPTELAVRLEELREQLQQATIDLWKVVASWTRDQMLDAGALVYFASVRDLAHLAGVYDQSDWFTLDPRVQRFKPLMNDEYGRDALGELVGSVSLPGQQTHEYAMTRFTDTNKNMESLIPYSVLVNDEWTPTSGPIRPGATTLPAKTGLWTTSRGRLDVNELNAAARTAGPAVLEEPYRYLDDEWIKTHWQDPLADELYRRTQRTSRSLAGRGAGLRRRDLPQTRS